jgi:ABC-type transporter Mla subunit MlaD
LEAIYEIVNMIYSFTKGRTRRRVVITLLLFFALLGLFCWWMVNVSAG